METGAQKSEAMALDRCVTSMPYELKLVLQGIYEWQGAAQAGVQIPRSGFAI
jgi:hypothetical protein